MNSERKNEIKLPPIMAVRGGSEKEYIIRGCCEDRCHSSMPHGFCCPHHEWITPHADSEQSDVRDEWLLAG